MATPANTDILTKIEEGLKDTIEALKQGEYYWTWGTVNEIDHARQRYPSADIRLVDEANTDIDANALSTGYRDVATYEIVVRARASVETENYHDVQDELNRCLHDLKKAFGTNYTVSGTCSVIMYQGMRREFTQNGDVLIPQSMITTWSVEYLTQRKEPSQTASS